MTEPTDTTTQNGLLPDSDSTTKSVAIEVVEIGELTFDEQRDSEALTCQFAFTLNARLNERFMKQVRL
jgi:hypothetical protein